MRGHDQDRVAAQDVVRADPAEDEDDRRQRDRGGDQQEDVGERAEQLADDDRERRDRGRRQHVERLLLALEADRAGREGRREEHDEQGLDIRMSAPKTSWPTSAEAKAAEPPWSDAFWT